MKAMHLDRNWLEEKYVKDGLSTYDIGALVNRNPKRIYEKLKDFGIPTRPRGLNLQGADNFMEIADRSGAANLFFGKKHTRKTRAILSAKASVPKPHLRGPRNGMSGRCGPLNPNYIDGSSPERQRIYASGESKAFMRAINERDQNTCRRCNATRQSMGGMCVHHIKSWAGHHELRFDPNNVVTLCRPCHIWVHSRENVRLEFR